MLAPSTRVTPGPAADNLTYERAVWLAGNDRSQGLRRRARGEALGDELEAVVGDDDPESLSFAERRGFTEDRREKGVALRLAEIEAPAVEPPDGIEIVS